MTRWFQVAEGGVTTIRKYLASKENKNEISYHDGVNLSVSRTDRVDLSVVSTTQTTDLRSPAVFPVQRIERDRPCRGAEMICQMLQVG